MSLTYRTDLTVHSVIDNLTDLGIPDGDPEINIFTTSGDFSHDGNTVKISYDEKGDGYVTHCSIVVDGEKVLLSRSGAVECDIVFKEGDICNCIYRVPPYAFDMSVTTAKIRNSITENGGELQLIYSMNIGGQDKKVRMKIKSAGKE